MTRLWNRIPVIVRAVLVGYLVNEAGQPRSPFSPFSSP
jgi:hypothetical protein